MIVTTLPVSYRENRSFKIFFPAFLAKCLSKLLNSDLVVSVDLLGSRGTGNKQDHSEIVSSYIGELKTIGVNVSDSRIFNNADADFCEYVQEQTSRNIAQGTVCRQLSNVTHCSCGKIELPTEVFKSLIEQNRLHHTTTQLNGDPACKFCKSELVTDMVEVLVHQQQQVTNTNIIAPSSYEKRVEAIIGEISKHPLFISRRFRSSNGLISIEGENLDPDYCWGHYICFLAEKYGENEFVLVTGIDCLVQACKVLVLTRKINPFIKLNLCIHPKIHIRDGNQEFHCKTSTDYLRHCGNSEVAQIFLSLGMQWNRFDSVIPVSDLALVKKSLQGKDIKFETENESELSIEDVMSWLKRDTILRTLKVLRQRSKLDQKQQLILNAILS